MLLRDIHVILTENKLYGNSRNMMAHPENLVAVQLYLYVYTSKKAQTVQVAPRKNQKE